MVLNFNEAIFLIFLSASSPQMNQTAICKETTNKKQRKICPEI